MPTAPQPAPLTPPNWQAQLATRSAFLDVTLVAGLIGLAGAAGSGVATDLPRALLTLLLALCAHAGDIRSGAAANALLLVAIPAGLWLGAQSPGGAIAVALGSVILGRAYSAAPGRRPGHGLDELAILAGVWLVVAGADHLQRGAFSPVPILAGLPYALLAAALGYLQPFAVRNADLGQRALVTRLGRDTAKWGFLMLCLAAYMTLVFAIERNALPQKSAVAAFTLVLSFRAARDLIAHAGEPGALAGATRLTRIATPLHGLLLASALAFAPWPSPLR